MKISHRDITDEQRTIGSTIVFDNGDEMPAYARSAYFPAAVAHGCEPPMPGPQRRKVDGMLDNDRALRLTMRRVDGSVFVTKSFFQYAPGIWRVYPDGSVKRVDAPYGNGTEA